MRSVDQHFFNRSDSENKVVPTFIVFLLHVSKENGKIKENINNAKMCIVTFDIINK